MMIREKTMYSIIGRTLGFMVVVALAGAPLLVNTAVACNGCAAHSKVAVPDQGMQHEASQQVNGMVETMDHAKGTSLGMIMTAENLYSCPMHSEVVAVDAETSCPICNMDLTPMSQVDVEKLRSSHPAGCPMDPIVVAGDSDTEACPICKMDLTEIQLPDMDNGHVHRQ
jgi:hypothetical protein